MSEILNTLELDMLIAQQELKHLRNITPSKEELEKIVLESVKEILRMQAA